MVLQKLPNINARAGENVKFSVQFDGEPEIIEWTKNGAAIADSDRCKVSNRTTKISFHFSHWLQTGIERGRAILQISRVTPDDAGMWYYKTTSRS